MATETASQIFVSVCVALAEFRFHRLSLNVYGMKQLRRDWTVPWPRQLVAGLSLRRPGFAPGSIHVGFEVGKVALRQVFLLVLRFSPFKII
jgi:hypothetical protein